MSSEHRRDGVETHFGLLGGQHVGMFATDFSHSTSASVIEADGNYGATFSMPYWWTEVRPSALFIVLHRLHAPFIQQGAKGPVIISETTRGDLVVANLQTKQRTLNGVSIRREDYTPLTRAQSAIDPEGNTYIAVVFGGRTVSDQRLAICRVPFEGEPACMQLAQSPEFEGEREFIQLATNADGVLFLRTEKAFARIDFPGR
jgi:hypothetical protein